MKINTKVVPFTRDNGEEILRARRAFAAFVAAMLLLGALMGSIVTSCVSSCSNDAETVEVYRVVYTDGMNLRVQPSTGSNRIGSGFSFGDFIVATEVKQIGDSTWIATETASGSGWVCASDESQTYLQRIYGSQQIDLAEDTPVYSARVLEEVFLRTTIPARSRVAVLAFEANWTVILLDGQVGYIPA